ncbi:MAG: lysophospholipase [Flavobacteriales bacterium]|nr:lysophospholipase [Flavobacteriales bacterium]
MIDFKDKVYEGSEKRKSLFDCQIPEGAKAVVIFVHGYKGYKDWGAWNLVQKRFINAGFGFVKFNMSHNGGTVGNSIDFPDLDAFGRNCYSYELDDLHTIIQETHRMIHQELELTIPIYLLGHSRGGGVSVLAAAENDKIAKIISLAGISDIGSRFPEGDLLDDWKIAGVQHVKNARTNQMMPHFYSFYEDFERNVDRLNIEKAATSLKIPFLQIHGDMDVSVSISEGMRLAQWTNTRLSVIKGAEHTFGTKQPWNSNEIPDDMEKVIEKAIEFFT